MTAPDPKDGPTQTQIEALELIDTFAWSCVKTDCRESRVELQRRIDKCRAALSAAAEVQTDFLCPKCGSRGYIKDGATTITAAAEVGEQGTPQIYAVAAAWEQDVKQKINATIERCAQVVRRYAVNIGDMAETIAVEIETMKD